MNTRKIAFLIIAHNQPNYLRKLIYMLSCPRTSIYIHINPQSINQFKSLIDEESSENVHFYSKYIIKWGGYRIIDTEKLLLEEAMKDSSNERFILMSGVDIICKPLNSIIDFFMAPSNQDYQFVSGVKLSDIWKGRGYNRIQYFHIFDLINLNRKLTSKINKVLVTIQKILRIKRDISYISQYYGGSGWWNINRAGATVLLSGLNEKKLESIFLYSFAPDEMLPQTILINNKSLKIVNKTFRYTDWSTKPAPATLNKDYIIQVSKEDIFFARKVDEKISDEFIEYCIELQKIK